MEVVNERCCGLDIHKKNVVACLIVSGAETSPVKEVRSFGTMTQDILAMADWLESAGCTVVAMESTGVYWKPVYNLLEEHFELMLVNAQHIKAVPGRKTDVKDAEWIADLLRHGLLKASFVPNRQQRELRELIRFRRSLVEERASVLNRLQKVLEGANIKLASVVSSVDGRSARAMLEELVSGSTDTAAMADLAKGRLKEKIPELQKALEGKFGPHQRFVVSELLAHLDYLEAAIERASAEVRERTRPFEEAVEQLDTIPGVGRETAETIVAEVGTDMSRFPSERHLAAWAGLAPSNNESAGKKKSSRARKGNRSLKTALVQAAQAAGRSKDNYLSARYHRLAARRGNNRASLAVAHTILTIAYHLLNRHEEYRDLGPHYLDQRNKESSRRYLVRRLQDLGYKVSVEPVVEVA